MREIEQESGARIQAKRDEGIVEMSGDPAAIARAQELITGVLNSAAQGEAPRTAHGGS